MDKCAGKLDHEELFDSVIQLIKDYVVKYRERSSKVVDFKTPSELKELIDFTVREEGVATKDILTLCDKVMELSVHTNHPHFYNTLFCAPDEVSLLGSFLSTTSNVNVYTYEMAPVYTLMEGQVQSQVRQLIGWNGGDGMFAPGGSIANLYGLLLARYHRFPESKQKGFLSLPKMAFFCSEQSHYSVLKSAIIMGIGTENVVKIKCDLRGRMIVRELEEELIKVISVGTVPVAVVATAGTTVLGAIDPLEEIADVCERHKVWLHIDGAIGGALLFSRTHKHKLAGIERSDSVAWNPHKSMSVPLQCSLLNTRHEHLLAQCMSTKAGYLFQEDKIGYDTSLDTGDKSIQCGRLSDVFKFWLFWKHQGMQGFEKRMDKNMELTRYFKEQVKARPRFHLLVEEPDSTNVCFWYVPPCLQDFSIGMSEKPMECSERLNKVAPIIKARMVANGNMMIAYQPLPGGVPNCLRMVSVNPRSTKEDMDHVLDEIQSLGHDIVV